MRTGKIEWMYHRKNCTTCQRSDSYLNERGMTVSQIVDCKKEPLVLKDAKKLLNGIEKLYATKGQKVVSVDLKAQKPTDEQLQSLIIGPSGKLRAPTIRHGAVMVVGFNEDMYDEALSN